MQYIESFYKKTVLEHLINRDGANNEDVSKKLQITPRQLADWLARSHPIPDKQLREFEKMFDVPAELLADENRYARRLTPLSMIELDILDVKAKIKTGDEESTDGLRKQLEQLQSKRDKHKLLVRIAGALENPDPFVMEKIDQVITNLEKEE
jgi:hypothetical protein